MALKGIRVVEFAGLAPAPFCGMILSDFGAKVIRIDKSGGAGGMAADPLARGKQSIALNLKNTSAVNIAQKLVNKADVLIEPFRPGVMEKLGLGPQVFTKTNPRLIYARMTGYGQKGTLADRAGHDINYLAISGILSRLGREGEKPYAPINLLGDFGGGGLTCALGVLLALFEREKSGKGQVIDCNMVEGANYLSSFVWRSIQTPLWGPERGQGFLDGGAPWYDTYKTKDDKYMAVGAIEPQFYAELIKGLGFSSDDAPQFGDFPALRQMFTDRFGSKTQEEWCKVFDHVDACVTPILTMDEAAAYPHNTSKGSFFKGTMTDHVPRPAPELERTPSLQEDLPQPKPGQHTREILDDLDFSQDDVNELLKSGAAQQTEPKSKI